MAAFLRDTQEHEARVRKKVQQAAQPPNAEPVQSREAHKLGSACRAALQLKLSHWDTQQAPDACMIMVMRRAGPPVNSICCSCML